MTIATATAEFTTQKATAACTQPRLQKLATLAKYAPLVSSTTAHTGHLQAPAQRHISPQLLRSAGTPNSRTHAALGRLSADVVTSADGPVGDHLERLRWSARWSFGGDLLMANDAAVLYLMVMQPELAGSLVIVTGTNLGVAAVRAMTVGYGFRGATGAEVTPAAATDARGRAGLLREARHG